MSTLRPPSIVRSADDLLPLAQALVDAETEAIEADPTVDVTCRAGCFACCSQAVPVTRSEVRAILAAIDQLDDELRQTIHRRIREIVQRLQAAGLRQVTSDDSPVRRREMANAYFAVGVPCPLLEDGVCSVRASRPLICREFLVTSEASECSKLGRGETVVRIRSKQDIVAGFADVSRITGEPDYMTLAFALGQPASSAIAAASLSGAKLTARMLSHRVS